MGKKSKRLNGKVRSVGETLEECHGGKGSVVFRRLFDKTDFSSRLDFIDYTIIPPQASIGYHLHLGTEEVYFITRGEALMTVEGEKFHLEPGDAVITRSGESHGLQNYGKEPVEIFVIQVHAEGGVEE